MMMKLVKQHPNGEGNPETNKKSLTVYVYNHDELITEESIVVSVFSTDATEEELLLNKGDNKVAVGETGNDGKVVFNNLDIGTYVLTAYSDDSFDVQEFDLNNDDYYNLNLLNPRSFEHELTIEDSEGNPLSDVEVYRNG